MSIAITSATVPGTTRPWNFAAITPNAGGSVVQVGFNANLTDGSSGGGSVGQNNTRTFGQQHVSPAGETSPITVAVTPGESVFVQYISGTVAAFSGGTAFGPRGDTSGTTGLSPTIDYTDNTGYVYPTNCMPAAQNAQLVNPTTGRVGIVGCFTDSSGNIIANSFWDWKSRGGTDAGNSSIGFIAPTGAAFISIGINDTLLRDNTGSFSIKVYVLDTSGFTGDNTFFMHSPIGVTGNAFIGDQTAYKSSVYLAIGPVALVDSSTTGLMSGYFGQLFPHGAQNSGGTPSGSQGQNFPY